MLSPSDLIIDEIGTVASLAIIYEVRLRIIADKTPELKSKSHEKSLEVLEQAFLEHFKAYLKPEGVALLQTGRQLRNKILHSDFRAAAKKVETISPGSLEKGTVRAVDLRTGSVRTVSNESSKDVGIYGWLLEMKTSGALQESRDIFAKMNAILCSISDAVANAEAESGRRS